MSKLKCRHPISKVYADILEGDVRNQRVEWCSACGAYRRGFWEAMGFASHGWKWQEWREPNWVESIAKALEEA